VQSKRQARQELERLVARYLQDGGEIRRDGGNSVILVCGRCRVYRYVALAHALQFKPKCRRGSDMKIVG
jgi:hypothetical protein